jgi:uncharacterized membrane protein
LPRTRPLAALYAKNSQVKAIEDSGSPVAESGMNEVLVRNIKTLLEKRRQEEQGSSAEQKAADAITRFVGSMPFVYIHAVIFTLWTIINVGWLPLPRFDPTFVILGTSASVEAIFLSTFILISQNRMSLLSERRADLDLQVSLLSEHEVTKLIQLVSQIGEKIGVNDSTSPELDELKQDVHPEKVLDRIEQESRD